MDNLTASLRLTDAKAAFSSCSGETKGSYSFEIIAIYENDRKDIFHRGYTVKFLPTHPFYYLSNFEVNTEGAYKRAGKIVSPHNPIPTELMKAVNAELRHVAKNVDGLLLCRRKTGEAMNKRHYHSSNTGQFFVEEKINISKIDFLNFIENNDGKITVLVKDGTEKY